MNAVVTGATKGIGRAVAFALAEEGCQVAVCSRHAEDVKGLVSELEAKCPGQRFPGMAANLEIRDEIRAFGDFVLEQLESIDILVNNAGVFLPGEIHSEADGRFEKQMNANLHSVYHLTRRLVPAMLRQRSGHIFNMCSVASFGAYPNGGSYAISKYALLGLTRNLRMELKEKGIKVCAIIPGATWSHSWKGADLPGDRLMQPEDVAQAVVCALRMGKNAVLEEIIIRPQLGDL